MNVYWRSSAWQENEQLETAQYFEVLLSAFYEGSLMSLFVTVDRMLNPANRLHMSLEVQLSALLEMLDLTSAMKSSPSRSKRLKLLKKSINDVRLEMNQKSTCPPSEQSQSQETPPVPVPECWEEGAYLLHYFIALNYWV